jgi:hypothetical protein
MFGLPWFKREETSETDTIETVQEVSTDGYTHAYDVPAYLPDGKGGYIKGIAQVFIEEEEEEDSVTMLGHLAAGWLRSTGKIK